MSVSLTFLVVGHIHEDIVSGVAGSRSSWVQWQQLGEDSEIHNLVAAKSPGVKMWTTRMQTTAIKFPDSECDA